MPLPDDHFDVEDLICNESFQQYCLGSTLEHQLLWKEWINRFPDRKKDIEEAKELVNILNVKQGSRIRQINMLRSGLEQSAKMKAIFYGKKEEIPAETPIYYDTPAKKSGTVSAMRYLSGIAALLLAVIATYLYIRPFSNAKTPVIAPVTYFSSGKALRKTVILKDGSVITLAPESSIRLQEGFDSLKRELTLSGEAFFDVRHDAAHPFIVHTAFNDIKVLGTTFNVKAYPDSGSMEAALIRGKVRIDSKQYPGYFVVLQPNQKLMVKQPAKNRPAVADYQVAALKLGDHVVPEEIQWVRKRLDLDNLPLSVIAKKLQEWYGIEIVISGEEVKNYRYSGVFENETILKILEALQLSYPFQFEIEGNKITIKK